MQPKKYSKLLEHFKFFVQSFNVAANNLAINCISLVDMEDVSICRQKNKHKVPENLVKKTRKQ